jgi:uncharacterized protein (TIGR03000 family)
MKINRGLTLGGGLASALAALLLGAGPAAAQASGESMTDPNAVSINIRVPADATVSFDRPSTRQQGTFRVFVSPPVQQGRDYSYDIKAEWTENGKKVAKPNPVTLHAGDRPTLDMLQGDQGKATLGLVKFPWPWKPGGKGDKGPVVPPRPPPPPPPPTPRPPTPPPPPPDAEIARRSGLTAADLELLRQHADRPESQYTLQRLAELTRKAATDPWYAARLQEYGKDVKSTLDAYRAPYRGKGSGGGKGGGGDKGGGGKGGGGGGGSGRIGGHPPHEGGPSESPMSLGGNGGHVLVKKPLPNMTNPSAVSIDSRVPEQLSEPLPALVFDPNAVSINIRVPADAKVWFDGQSTRQQGTIRQFVSPPLPQGQDYTYDIKAEWTENGQTVDKTRTVTVQAGDRLTLDMLQGDHGTPTLGLFRWPGNPGGQGGHGPVVKPLPEKPDPQAEHPPTQKPPGRGWSIPTTPTQPGGMAGGPKGVVVDPPDLRWLDTMNQGPQKPSSPDMTNTNAVPLNVRVPAQAKVWIKAEWTENGKKVEKTKMVTVQAGDRPTLDMLQGDNGMATGDQGAIKRLPPHGIRPPRSDPGTGTGEKGGGQKQPGDPGR